MLELFTKNNCTYLSIDPNIHVVNTLFKHLIILSFFFVSACGGRKPTKPNTETGTPPQSRSPIQSSLPKPHNPNDCKASVMQVKNADCFHQLPALGNGQTFTSNYKDILNIYTKGVTVGKGMWRCQKGTWYEHYNVCLTCLPGHSLEHCQTELNRLIQLNP